MFFMSFYGSCSASSPGLSVLEEDSSSVAISDFSFLSLCVFLFIIGHRVFCCVEMTGNKRRNISLILDIVIVNTFK